MRLTLRDSGWVFLFAFVATSLVWRALLVWALKWDAPNGDEAVAGLMAKHIAEARDWPVFFYGQAYFGALEPYINALLFRVFGFSPNAIFAVPVVCGALIVLVEVRLASMLFGKEVALLCGLLVALGPAAFIEGTLSAAGGFGLAALLELVAVQLYLSMYVSDQVGAGSFLAFCLVSGLLFWVWQLYIPVWLALVFLWIWRGPRVRGPMVGGGIILFLLASAPLWFYNLNNHWATFSQTFGKFTAADSSAGLVSFGRNFLGNRLWNLSAYTDGWISSVDGGNPIALVVIFMGILIIVSRIKLSAGPGRIPATRISLLLAISAVVFVSGHGSTRYLYLLPLMLLPCAMVGWQSLGQRSMVLIALLVAASNVASVVQVAATPASRSDHGWVHILESQSLAFGYSDFWHAYPITFLSGERIIVAPILTTPAGERTDRYPAYAANVSNAPEAFVLMPDGSPDRADFESWLARDPSGFGLQSLSVFDATLHWPLPSSSMARQVLEKAEGGPHQ